MLRFLTPLVVAVSLWLGIGLAHAEQKALKMGMLAWEDTKSTSLITKKFLEKEGFKVDTTEFAEWGIAFAALKKGDIDLLVSHINYVASDYWSKSNSSLEKVSVASHGLNQGLVVPSYMPVDSVDQLNSVKDQVGGKIIGIEPGSGLMREVANAVKEYKLDYQLIEGSSPAMTAQLQGTLQRKEPIVTMLWTPSWMALRFDVKFLKDPKGVFAPPQSYYWIARKGWSAENPHARESLASVFVPIEDVSGISAALNTGKTMEAAVDDWWTRNASLVARWSVMSSQ